VADVIAGPAGAVGGAPVAAIVTVKGAMAGKSFVWGVAVITNERSNPVLAAGRVTMLNSFDFWPGKNVTGRFFKGA
jgi:hypothetical protein